MIKTVSKGVDDNIYILNEQFILNFTSCFTFFQFLYRII